MTQRIQIEHIVAATCAQYNLTPEQMRSRSRVRRIARPRQIAMTLVRELTNRSFPNIGNYFHRDHSTAIHARDTITAKRAVNPNLALQMAAITARASQIASATRVAATWLVRDRDGNVLLESIADEKAQAA